MKRSPVRVPHRCRKEQGTELVVVSIRYGNTPPFLVTLARINCKLSGDECRSRSGHVEISIAYV